jgi:hypothetical protein
MYDHVFSSIPFTAQQIDNAIVAAKAERAQTLQVLLAQLPDAFKQAYARIKQSRHGFGLSLKHS